MWGRHTQLVVFIGGSRPPPYTLLGAGRRDTQKKKYCNAGTRAGRIVRRPSLLEMSALFIYFMRTWVVRFLCFFSFLGEGSLRFFSNLMCDSCEGLCVTKNLYLR